MMEYKMLNIDSVKLDRDNPRIKHFLEMYGENVSSEKIALALNSSGGDSSSSYAALKGSIKVHGGLINPIIVNKKESGNMIVVEGNTRLQIYREFNRVDSSGKWSNILAIVYDNLPSDKIHAIRLQTHLVGPRDWDPFSKAKYLNQLSNIDHLPLATIISYCGGKKAEIIRLIDAYNDMKDYYFPEIQKAGDDPVIKEFSKFAELQNGGIISALDAHNFTKQDFAKWVVDGNIDTAQNVRYLPEILKNPTAREEFLKSNISNAIKYLDMNEKMSKMLASISMNDLVLELTKRLKKCSYEEFEALKNDPRRSGDKENIRYLKEDLNDFWENIED